MQESSVHALMMIKKKSTTTLEHFCLVQVSFLKVLYKCFQKIEVLFIQWARGLSVVCTQVFIVKALVPPFTAHTHTLCDKNILQSCTAASDCSRFSAPWPLKVQYRGA